MEQLLVGFICRNFGLCGAQFKYRRTEKELKMMDNKNKSGNICALLFTGL